MIVKRYTGKTAEEALVLAKWELGEDAIILSSGKARDRWWKFWEKGYQVLVATDYPKRPHETHQTESVSHPTTSLNETAAAAVMQSPSVPADDERLGQVLDLLHGLDHRLDRIEGIPQGRAEEVYQWLLSQEVVESWARRLAHEVASETGGWDHESLEQTVERLLLTHLTQPSPISVSEPTVVALIGPTGSGKTTTIAKLAAYFHLEQQKSVLLVTTDTYRVAAVEQIKTYAEILGIPLVVALRPQDIPGLLQKHSADVVLVDTAGHSVNHGLYMAEIQSIVQFAQAREVLVTLPATMGPSEMIETAHRFARELAVKLCITKVDEAHHGGSVLSALLSLGWPLAYVTDGQGVPDDIRVAFPNTIAQWIAKGVL
ncbi:MAG: flagellar biosynthesis protein FlhF [Sulfobacillus sp.]